MTGARLALIVVMSVMALGASASTKTERTYYTDQRLGHMRENIERYDWARGMRDRTVEAAELWLEYPDEELRMMVPPPQLPRAAYVRETGCPVHGLEIRKRGTYAWKHSLDNLFKVTCPVGGEAYPDNDFEAYYRSCFVDGVYDPEAGDRSLLTGERVDDGWGWDDPDDDSDQKYWFVAYYVHWRLISGVVYPVLRDCAQAYLITGDERFAHKAAVMLWQLAQYYPDYAYEKQSRHGTENNPNYRGKLRYHTWETSTVGLAALAYDAVFPHLAQDAALQEMTGQTGAEIAEHVEGRMLREMARLVMDGSHTIQGNYGSHQQALLKLALVCGDEEHEPRRSQMTDWVLNNDQVSGYTDLGLNDALYNVVFRDGVPFESPGYNTGWVVNLLQMATMLDECGVGIFAEPRLKALCDWPIDMTCAERFTPALGDSGNMYQRAVGRTGSIYAPAFSAYRDPRYAKLYADIQGVPAHDLFGECLDEEMAAAAEGAPPIGVGSFLFPGYGMSILQTGNEANRTALMLYQGAGRWAHAHYDEMHLDIYSHGMSLIPDFGYPETANSRDPRRFGFFSHSVAHNMVMVDQRRAERADGRLSAFDPGGPCQVVRAHAEDKYPGVVSRYDRTLALVDATDSDAYVVDIFRVAGGQQHDWIVHGPDAGFGMTVPLSEPRTEGTLAGTNVEYGSFYDDEKLRDEPYGSVSYISYRGSAFQYLYNVQEGALDGSAQAEWALRLSAERPPSLDVEGIVLRAHLLGEDERLLVCDGKPQQNTRATPESVKFLLRRRSGEDLTSTFVTVFEPYRDEPFLISVQRLTVTPADPDVVALRIELADGGVHIIVSAPEPGTRYETEGGVSFDGTLGAVSLDPAGEVLWAKLVNGSELRAGDFGLICDGPRTVSIQSMDYGEGVITLAEPALTGEAMVGRWVTIGNQWRSTAWRVEEVLDARRFSIGDQDPRCARLLPAEFDADTATLVSPTITYFGRPGMYLADEQFRILGRVTETAGNRRYTLTEADLDLAALPDADGDGRARVWLMEFAPGDEVRLPSSATYHRRLP